MKKNNKGFTLIELLAVIIILAIIALIAVPTIMDIINKSKDKAALDAAHGVASAAELWYTNQLLEKNGGSLTTDVTFKCETTGCKNSPAEGEEEHELSIKGDVPTHGTIKVTKEGKINTEDGKPLEFSVSSKQFKIVDGEVEEVPVS